MNIALILSGGMGRRFGSDIPKQYALVGGKSVISYCIEALSMHDAIDGMQIVADASWREFIQSWLYEADRHRKFKGFSNPGKNRQLSILNGLKDIRNYADDSDCVFIHDAVRPLLSQKQITNCLGAMKGHDGVMPVLPMKDTVYLSKDGKKIFSLLKRKQVYRGQAPEVFRLGRYYEANCQLLPKQILYVNGSTEPAVMAGLDVVLIPGDENNFKITTKADMERFQGIVQGLDLSKDIQAE